MDKLGAAIGFFGKFRVIVSVIEKLVTIIINSTREWAIFIKCINAEGEALFFYFFI